MQEYLGQSKTLIERYKTDEEHGLTKEQAKKNAELYGVNTLTKKKTESFLKRLLTSLKEPMILMLISAGLIALGVNIFRFVQYGEGDFLECVGIFVAIALSVVITVAMEGRSAKAFEAMNMITEDIQIKALRNGTTVVLKQKDIVVGDILLLATGDKIPADGRILSSSNLSADESVLTGESMPAPKKEQNYETEQEIPLASRNNMLYAGTYITSGFCKIVVSAVGDNTEFGLIASELSKPGNSTTPLQEKLSRLGKWITLFGVVAAAIVFIAQLITFAMHNGLEAGEVLDAFVTSVILIVAAVPEGLPTIVAVSLSINIIKLSKQNALVKKMIACETIGCVDIICSDKTGTLTENRMVVINEVKNEYILKNICVNSTADLGEGGLFLGNPTECSMLAASKQEAWDYAECRNRAKIVHIFPFTSEEKNMTTVIEAEEGYIVYTKGSPEKILQLCDISLEARREAERNIAGYQQKACRIIAFAHKKISHRSCFDKNEVEQNMSFDGFAAISDPLRKDVYEAVKQCKMAGVELKILTGDNILTATAIAHDLELLNSGQVAVEATELEALSDEELGARLPSICVIARSTPKVKMRVVQLLKKEGHIVAVTGDGINDAPAIKNADVGIAMGVSGTEVSKEASDIVLLNDSFSTIVKAIEWGRGIYENFKRFICFQLTVNISSVFVVLASILLGLKAPFTALQLLWINIIMDGPPALTLGLEPPHEDLMKRVPVRRAENILSKSLMMRIGLLGAYISSIFLLQYTQNFLGASQEQMPTVLFTMFALFQLFNAFNCREVGAVSIFKNIMKNRIMLVVLLFTFVMQVLITQFAGAFFGTVPLPNIMWAKIFAVSFSVIVVSELAKLLYRMGKKKTGR